MHRMRILPFSAVVIMASLTLARAEAVVDSPSAPSEHNLAAPIQSADAELQDLLKGEGPLLLAGRLLDRPLLTTLYERRGFLPLWDAERREGLRRAIAEGASHGLDPADYALPDFPDPAEVSPAHELLLTDAFLRYARALAQGRVVLHKDDPDWLIPTPSFDAIAAVEEAARGTIQEIAASFAPHDPRYEALRQALARYRQWEAAGGWPKLPAKTSIRPGERGPAVATLRHRLAIEGYLGRDNGNAKYEAGLLTAVKAFQTAHGIRPDGNVGAATVAALNVSATMRVNEILMSLERWRMLPHEMPNDR
ncbi:MAG TPA: peptidoglycan-binding protein, partial [Stellaceae bacterium]|nr:peptidoglycan-binding protein [Stellaceae bacterium]